MAKKASKYKAGEYTLPMLEFIGEENLRESVKESDIAIERSQGFNRDVRTKAQGTAGVLATIVIALFMATYTVAASNWVFHTGCICLMAVLGYGILRLFWDIIYSKHNETGGSTLSYLFPQGVLDGLGTAKDEEERRRLFLFYELERKENVCNEIDTKTTRMQKCYKSTMTFVYYAFVAIITLSLFVSWLCRVLGVAAAC